MEQTKKLLLDVNEKPTIAKWIILALQHVFAMFGATILVPIMVNTSAGETVLTIPVALVTSGIGTLIYILCTKARVPIYLGSSFAYISYIQTATLTSGGNYGSALTGLVIVGLVYVVVAIIIRIVGVNWLNKLLPPVVIGPVIMVIGLGLATSAVANMNTVGVTGGSQYMSLLMGLVAMFITAICSHFGKRMVSLIPFVIGMGSTYVLSLILTLIGRAAGVPALQIVDLTPLTSLDWTSWKSYRPGPCTWCA